MLQDAPRLIIDSAHNPQSARVLAGELTRLAEGPSWTLVFGCMADKDINGMLVSLLPAANRVILTKAQHPRAMPVDGLLEYVRAGWPDFSAVSARQTVSEALAVALEGASERDNICVAGSLAVAGEAMAAWERLSASPDEYHGRPIVPTDHPASMLEI
jgi:dihydrofolate synthase/folylpolyglutamate synthase